MNIIEDIKREISNFYCKYDKEPNLIILNPEGIKLLREIDRYFTIRWRDLNPITAFGLKTEINPSADYLFKIVLEV